MVIKHASFNETAFLNILDVHVSEIEKYPGSLQNIYFKRHFEAIIVRNLFPENVMEQVIERLRKEDDMNSVFVNSESKSALIKNINHSYGPGVFGSQPDLKEYFLKASIFREKCRFLFPDNIDYEKRVESAIRSLSGGVAGEIPVGQQGQSYNSSSIRIIPDGHQIPIHVGNDLLLLPQSNHIRTLIDPIAQISFFIPLSLPKAGGDLVVYNLEFDPETSQKNQNVNLYELGLKTKNIDTDRYERKVLAPGVGDMLLFDGGRYYHRVTQVVGKTPRITMGGFINFSSSHDKIYYWN